MMSRPVVNTLGAALVVVAAGLIIRASAADRNPNDPYSSKPYGSKEAASSQQMLSLAGTWRLDMTRGDVKKEYKPESSSKDKDKDKDRDDLQPSSSMGQPGNWSLRRLPHLLRISQTGDRINIADSSSTPVEVIRLAGADVSHMRPGAPADSARGGTWSDSMMMRGTDHGSDLHSRGTDDDEDSLRSRGGMRSNAGDSTMMRGSEMHGHADSTMMRNPGMHSQRSDMGMMGSPLQVTGRWEGKSLVVEKSSAENNRQMTQAFTVIDDGRTLEIRTKASSTGYPESSKDKDKDKSAKSFTRYYNRVSS